MSSSETDLMERVGPMGFRAGFISGMRATWRLPRWVVLEQFREDPYYGPGFKYGHKVASETDDADAMKIVEQNSVSASMMPLIEKAWSEHNGAKDDVSHIGIC